MLLHRTHTQEVNPGPGFKDILFSNNVLVINKQTQIHYYKFRNSAEQAFGVVSYLCAYFLVYLLF